jgi:hypothetical protein
VETTESASRSRITPTGLTSGLVLESIVAGSSSTTLTVPVRTLEPSRHSNNNKNKDNGLSPTAERLLIAVGAIGTVILVYFYLVLRLTVKLQVPLSLL